MSYTMNGMGSVSFSAKVNLSAGTASGTSSAPSPSPAPAALTSATRSALSRKGFAEKLPFKQSLKQVAARQRALKLLRANVRARDERKRALAASQAAQKASAAATTAASGTAQSKARSIASARSAASKAASSSQQAARLAESAARLAQARAIDAARNANSVNAAASAAAAAHAKSRSDAAQKASAAANARARSIASATTGAQAARLAEAAAKAAEAQAIEAKAGAEESATIAAVNAEDASGVNYLWIFGGIALGAVAGIAGMALAMSKGHQQSGARRTATARMAPNRRPRRNPSGQEKLNDKEREMWVSNTEELFYEWQASGSSLREFVRSKREHIDAYINKVCRPRRNGSARFTKGEVVERQTKSRSGAGKMSASWEGPWLFYSYLDRGGVALSHPKSGMQVIVPASSVRRVR